MPVHRMAPDGIEEASAPPSPNAWPKSVELLRQTFDPLKEIERWRHIFPESWRRRMVRE
jgi:hypothetical protein